MVPWPPPATSTWPDPADTVARHLAAAIDDRPGWEHLGVVGAHAATARFVAGSAGGTVTGNGSGWWWGAWDAEHRPIGANFRDDPLATAQDARDAVEAAVGAAPGPK